MELKQKQRLFWKYGFNPISGLPDSPRRDDYELSRNSDRDIREKNEKRRNHRRLMQSIEDKCSVVLDGKITEQI